MSFGRKKETDSKKDKKPANTTEFLPLRKTDSIEKIDLSEWRLTEEEYDNKGNIKTPPYERKKPKPTLHIRESLSSLPIFSTFSSSSSADSSETKSSEPPARTLVRKDSIVHMAHRLKDISAIEMLRDDKDTPSDLKKACDPLINFLKTVDPSINGKLPEKYIMRVVQELFHQLILSDSLDVAHLKLITNRVALELRNLMKDRKDRKDTELSKLAIELQTFESISFAIYMQQSLKGGFKFRLGKKDHSNDAEADAIFVSHCGDGNFGQVERYETTLELGLYLWFMKLATRVVETVKKKNIETGEDEFVDVVKFYIAIKRVPGEMKDEIEINEIIYNDTFRDTQETHCHPNVPATDKITGETVLLSRFADEGTLEKTLDHLRNNLLDSAKAHPDNINNTIKFVIGSFRHIWAGFRECHQQYHDKNGNKIVIGHLDHSLRNTLAFKTAIKGDKAFEMPVLVKLSDFGWSKIFQNLNQIFPRLGAFAEQVRRSDYGRAYKVGEMIKLSALPEDLSALPIKFNIAYILVEDKLYYYNKKTHANKAEELNVKNMSELHEALGMDRNPLPLDNIRSLSIKNISAINAYTRHHASSREEMYDYAYSELSLLSDLFAIQVLYLEIMLYLFKLKFDDIVWSQTYDATRHFERDNPNKYMMMDIVGLVSSPFVYLIDPQLKSLKPLANAFLKMIDFMNTFFYVWDPALSPAAQIDEAENKLFESLKLIEDNIDTLQIEPETKSESKQDVENIDDEKKVENAYSQTKHPSPISTPISTPETARKKKTANASTDPVATPSTIPGSVHFANIMHTSVDQAADTRTRKMTTADATADLNPINTASNPFKLETTIEEAKKFMVSANSNVTSTVVDTQNVNPINMKDEKNSL